MMSATLDIEDMKSVLNSKPNVTTNQHHMQKFVNIEQLNRTIVKYYFFLHIIMFEFHHF